MMDGSEPTPRFQEDDPSVEGRLFEEFTRRLDAVLERRISDRRLEQKLAEIKRRAGEPSDPEVAVPEDIASTSPEDGDRDVAWTTAAEIVAIANEVRDELVHSAESEADEIRTAARTRAEHLVAEAVLEAEEIRAAARKEAAALLAAARRKAEPREVQAGDRDREEPPEPEDALPPVPRPRRPAPRPVSEPLIPIQRSPERTEADRGRRP